MALAVLYVQKVYDTVKGEEIFEGLSNMGISALIIPKIKNTHDKCLKYVIIEGQKSERLITDWGLTQGSILSPTSFNIAINELIKRIKSNSQKEEINIIGIQKS